MYPVHDRCPRLRSSRSQRLHVHWIEITGQAGEEDLVVAVERLRS
jgi:hypothetical protein